MLTFPRLHALLCAALALALAGCAAGPPAGTATQAPQPSLTSTAAPPATEEAEPLDVPTQEGLASQITVVTVVQDLFLRQGPGPLYPAAGVVTGGTIVEVTGQNAESDWYQVNVSGLEGWLAAAFTEGQVLGELPVIEVPPPPSSETPAGVSLTPTAPVPVTGGEAVASIAAPDSDITAVVLVQFDVRSYDGQISFPEGDRQDRIFVQVQGFGEGLTAGDVEFALTCTGSGLENVVVQASNVSAGSPGCNSTWTRYFTQDHPNQTITIQLNAGAGALVNWRLAITAEN